MGYIRPLVAGQKPRAQGPEQRGPSDDMRAVGGSGSVVSLPAARTGDEDERRGEERLHARGGKGRAQLGHDRCGECAARSVRALLEAQP